MLNVLRPLLALTLLAFWCQNIVLAFPAIQYNSFEKRLLNDTNYAGNSTKIRGVNLGGWFIVEQWMTPDLFQSAQSMSKNNITAVDQWTLIQTINNQTATTKLLTNHWKTWINQSDFQQIKQLGLNTVRIPIPHWTFNSSSSEPYLGGGLEKPFIRQALLWAKQYGLDVLLDLHTAPNSQNGADHSGHIGPIQFGNVTASLNAARVYDSLKKIVQTYVNDGQYGGVVKAIEVLNEPQCSVLGASYMTNIYNQAYSTIKNAIASNVTKPPSIVLHDCWISPLSNWSPAVSQGGGLYGLPFILDTHRYHVFAPRNNMTASQHISLTHQDGQEIYNATQQLQRPILTGEFSLGISCTDCNYSTNQQIVTANRQFFETQTTAYEQGAGWIFWNWKSENNLPWSYKDAVQAQWIPTDPTEKSYAI